MPFYEHLLIGCGSTANQTGASTFLIEGIFGVEVSAYYNYENGRSSWGGWSPLTNENIVQTAIINIVIADGDSWEDTTNYTTDYEAHSITFLGGIELDGERFVVTVVL